MKPGVTKQQLIKSLEATLRLTREDIVALVLVSRYEPDDTVIIHSTGGIQTVDIACNSGIAIIRDVCRAID
ncbi:MAG: hypothetical protein E7255_08415 [Lachnospiraceae bacterium]|jgi:hypothetical protein|nr:hypothetical protein [Lachnospiraceae bacterium]